MIVPVSYLCGSDNITSTFYYMPRVKLFDENEVLVKAMNLFWKQGYSATSVQDLVSHLGINRASIYDTFGDKDKLFKKSFQLYRKQSREGLIQFFENKQNVKIGFSELFKNAIQEAINDKERKGCFVVNTITELVPNDESLNEVLEINKQDFINIFFEYLKKGKEIGQLKTNQDLKSLATLFYTLYNGIRVVSKVRPNKKELTDSIKVALSLLF
ncbi:MULTISPECIES: TetR/AcrR family transcriptional regulator [Cellulophaga]|uniref:TetR/AcrR family transcriptional regulator n=1 Tax=Cellulophaga TaxID=104264 RepID=UPI002091A9DF|nr:MULTISPECIES: TetR/AcrR family transcriptional regulator [Cellulophaga]MDO6769500.1 helix-turn-helix domain-containing protein [Cellulophaga sp. 1_MG-2023]